MINPSLTSLLLIVLFLLVSACGQNSVRLSSSIVPKDTMVFVLMDIHIAEAGSRTLVGDSINRQVVNYYQFVQDKYHINEKQFRESLLYYTNHPKLLEEIYSTMTEEMSKKEANMVKDR